MSFAFVPPETVAVPALGYAEHVVVPRGQTALVIVDMQNDFATPGGNLYVPAARESVPAIAELLARARRAEVRVAFTQDTALPDDPQWQIWPEHCRADTWGWQIIEELRPLSDEVVCPKNRYDGFYGSWLEHALSYLWRVGHLVLVGTLANVCVLHTAASAGLRWFHLVVPATGISALTPFEQALALHQISRLYRGAITRLTSEIFFE